MKFKSRMFVFFVCRRKGAIIARDTCAIARKGCPKSGKSSVGKIFHLTVNVENLPTMTFSCPNAPHKWKFWKEVSGSY